MRVRPIPKVGVRLEDCDYCGWTYELRELKRTKGGLACPTCYDNPAPPNKRKRKTEL